MKRFGYHKEYRPQPASNGPNDKSFYATQRWKRLRKMVLRRSPVCEDCGNKLATQVDHKDNNNQNNESCNLQALCHSCHSKKTNRDQNQ